MRGTSSSWPPASTRPKPFVTLPRGRSLPAVPAACSNSTHEPHSFSTLPRHHAYAGAWGRGGRRAVTLGDTRTLHGPRRRLRRVPGRRFDSVLAASSQRDTWDTGDIWDTWDTLPAPESSTMP